MSNTYAVIENTLVINTVISDEQYAQENGWILLIEGAGIGWSYINGQFIAPIAPILTQEETQAKNKLAAESLLQQTDWSATVDINNPEYSDPYLMNQSDFLTYRSLVRNIAVNPPTTQAVFPTMPNAIWSTQ